MQVVESKVLLQCQTQVFIHSNCMNSILLLLNLTAKVLWTDVMCSEQPCVAGYCGRIRIGATCLTQWDKASDSIRPFGQCPPHVHYETLICHTHPKVVPVKSASTRLPLDLKTLLISRLRNAIKDLEDGELRRGRTGRCSALTYPTGGVQSQ